MTTVEQRPTGRPGDAPSGPAGPRPGGPKSPPDYPAEPTPAGPPPRDDATGPRPDTTRPVPTPRPAPGPGRATGPTFPTPDPVPPPPPPTPGLAALVADAERHGAAWLHLLTTAADDGEFDEETRRQLNAAANHTACALTRLARIELPARPVPTTTPPGGLGSTPVRREPAGAAVVPVPMGRPGGPVMPPGATGEASAPGLAGVDARAGGAVAPESTPGAPFSMPARVGLPEFQTGAALLRGASC